MNLCAFVVELCSSGGLNHRRIEPPEQTVLDAAGAEAGGGAIFGKTGRAQPIEKGMEQAGHGSVLSTAKLRL
jgi:hypothetical protein